MLYINSMCQRISFAHLQGEYMVCGRGKKEKKRKSSGQSFIAGVLHTASTIIILIIQSGTNIDNSIFNAVIKYIYCVSLK